MKKRILVVFDLDGTLVKVTTTFHMLQYIFGWKYLFFSKLFMPLVLMNKLLKKDIYKLVLLYILLYNIKYVTLKYYAKIYFKYLISHDQLLNKKMINILMKVKNSKRYMTALLTSSLDIIANQFSCFGFNLIISSKIIYKENKFKRVIDLFGKKHKIIYSLSKQFKEVIIYEDLPESEYKKLPNVRIIRVKR